MQIDVQLFSVLREVLPPGSVRGRTVVALPDEPAPRLMDLVIVLGIDRRLGVPAAEFTARSSWQVLVNGLSEGNIHRQLHDGDLVQIFPSMAGG